MNKSLICRTADFIMNLSDLDGKQNPEAGVWQRKSFNWKLIVPSLYSYFEIPEHMEHGSVKTWTPTVNRRMQDMFLNFIKPPLKGPQTNMYENRMIRIVLHVLSSKEK